MVISQYWMLLTVCFIIQATEWPNNLFDKMEKTMGDLCPKVDICNRNSSEPTVMPNGLIGRRNRMSCCQGCSCHERCHEHMNCCYPDDHDAKFAEENKFSTMECLYVQTGTPDEQWPRNVPAYRIVSSAPKGGCVNNKHPEASIQDGVLPSCSKDPVASWGNLFPVYSKETDKIYKNAECALCHNTTDVDPWLPRLVCRDKNTDNKLPISQQVQFLERNLLTSNCYIAFHFSDPFILANKRCYHEIVSTCALPSHINMIPKVANMNLSSIEVREACESGLKSAFQTNTKVFRNIYCYMCNVRVRLMHQLTSCKMADTLARTLPGMFSVLLDAVFFKKMNHDGVSDKTIVFPEACLRNGPSQASEKCRNILCPSGQIRRRTGCKFPIIKWCLDAISIFFRLNHQQSKDNILTLSQQDIVKRWNWKERFLEKTPWPAPWKIKSIMHIGKNNSEESVSIMMTKMFSSPATMFHSIKRSMVKPWNISLNGSSISFDQSMMAYSIAWSTSVNGYVPVWVRRANSTSLLQMNVPNAESEILNIIYADRLNTLPRIVTKLFLCEQITLYIGEYDLAAHNTVLISNLTVRILYDMEFELVYDVNATLSVRVCLSDTVFKIRHATNGSRKKLFGHSVISMTVVLCVCIFPDYLVNSIPVIFGLCTHIIEVMVKVLNPRL